MSKKRYILESETPFADSLIWQLNRDYYHKEGVDAWRDNVVPHYLTSNSLVGRTYAELILGMLKDLAHQGQQTETVYILELGAGHGRLAFHILVHLDRLISQTEAHLPPYCYVLSDIIEDSLDFFQAHPQFKPYYDQGQLDVCYFDAVESTKMILRHAGKTIIAQELTQPIIGIANYFLDSLPNDLFYFKNGLAFSCSLRLEMDQDPRMMDEASLLEEVILTYSLELTKAPHYTDTVFENMLEDYCSLVSHTYLMFPQKGMQCLEHVLEFSQQGGMILSMDKGAHEIHNLIHAKQPEMITNGSMSFNVNFHAYKAYCEKNGGQAWFPTFSNFHLELGCLMHIEASDTYRETASAYHRVVDEYGPDDFNGLRKFSYQHLALMSLKDVIGLIRLGAYDSTMFQHVLPRIKELAQSITVNERNRLSQTMHETWKLYFNIGEPSDLAFEMAGLFYDLGYFQDALNYFNHSIDQHGHTADAYYNTALCYYQLREDALFVDTVKRGKEAFPAFENFGHLDRLDLRAK